MAQKPELFTRSEGDIMQSLTYKLHVSVWNISQDWIKKTTFEYAVTYYNFIYWIFLIHVDRYIVIPSIITPNRP